MPGGTAQQLYLPKTSQEYARDKESPEVTKRHRIPDLSIGLREDMIEATKSQRYQFKL
jgi:hypothetical protein